jgi:hypothetical protein
MNAEEVRNEAHAGDPEPAPANAAPPPIEAPTDTPPEAADAGPGAPVVNAQNVNAGVMYSAQQQTFQVLAAGPRQTRARFQARTWPSVHHQRIVGESTWRQAEYMLRRRRLLLVGGDPELGKATLALSILRKAVDDEPPQELMLCSELEDTIVVSLDRWAREPRYRRKAVLLKDGFANGNLSLVQLGARLTREYLDELTRALKAAGMFVIITSDRERVPTEWRSLHEEIYYEAALPSEAELLEFLNRELTDYAHRLQLGPQHRLELSEEQQRTVVSQIKTIPGLLRFRRNSFDALARKKLTLEQALDGFGDLTRWLMLELRDRDPAAWCLAFATCLLVADPLVRSVPWIHAVMLAEELSQWLEGRVPNWRRKRPRAFVEPDELLLQRAGLEFAEDAADSSRGDHVRFCDESYPARLWQVLSRSGRGLLWTIAPLLESHARSAESPLRASALVALGRAGSKYGVGSLLHRTRVLSRSDDLNDQVLLGRFLVGVDAGGSNLCLAPCLELLREAANAEKPRPWPFVIALRELGVKDPALAVREIATLAQYWACPRLSDLNAVHRALASLEASRTSAAAEANATVETARRARKRHRAVLSWAMDKMFEGGAIEVLAASVFAITGLCFGRNPAEVCALFLPDMGRSTALSLTPEDPTFGCVVAILFFEQFGVFSILERYPELAGDEPGGLKQSRVPVGLADDNARIEPFAEFLTASFDGLSLLPSPIAQPCQDHLLRLVKHWCHDAVRTTPTRDGVGRLLHCLRRDPATALAPALTSMLKDDESFRKPGSPLQTLARDALTGAFGERRPGSG